MTKLIKYNRNGIKKINKEQPVPIGTIVAFAGTAAPGGWLVCNGDQVSRTTYSSLDSVIKENYGSYTNGSGVAGSSHFRLPDLRGAIPIGAGTGARNAESGTGAISGGTALTARTLGTSTGAGTITLSSTESGSPAHNHSVSQNNHSHTTSDSNHTHPLGIGGVNVVNSTPARALPDGGGPTYPTSTVSAGFSVASSTSGITVSNNSGESATSAHSNNQPVLVVTYIIKAL